MKALILGGNGLLGMYLQKRAPSALKLFVPTKNDLNIQDTVKFDEFIASNKIEAVINAAGYTNVYLCEEHSDRAFMINAYAPAECAKITYRRGVKFIYFSTGFIFDGKKESPYVETDTPYPTNTYGASKYRGELFVARENPDSIIIRTDELFGYGVNTFGHNIVSNVLKSILDGKTVHLYDIKTSATYACDLADAVWEILARKNASGIYHIVNEGSFTYFEIAEMIASIVKKKVTAKKRSDILKLKVPKNCSLESERFDELGIPKMRKLEDALKSCIKEFL